MTTLIAAIAIAPAVVQGTTAEQGDLLVTTFDMPEGKVTLYLPDDMAAGDTIAGTVIAVPNGAGEQAARNEAVLTGYVVELQDQEPKTKGSRPSWVLPAGLTAVAISLVAPDGSTRGRSSGPLMPNDVANSPEGFSCDPISNSGGLMQVRGPFDGSFANTGATCGGSALTPLVETPRSCVFAGLPGQTGPTQVDVKEGGQNSRLHSNLVRVSLSASKTTLLRGERGTLTVSVTGLDGLSEDMFPVPCTIVNRSPSVVRLEGDPNFDHLATGQAQGDDRPTEEVAFYYNKIDVKPGMPVTTNFTIVGVQPGQFLIGAICFNVKMHDVKKAMNAATFRAWVAGLITAYEEKIKKLEAEEKESPNAGRRLNIQRKKKILDVLKAFRNPGNADLDVSKTAVDKVLADDAFFAMAAELITTAAEMLGYTDIPMPGIGQIVKGIKAIAGAAKLQKVLDALATVEKLIEEYEKLKDAQEKIEKAQKIKEALDKVKEAMDASD